MLTISGHAHRLDFAYFMFGRRPDQAFHRCHVGIPYSCPNQPPLGLYADKGTADRLLR